ncbi:MAG: DNA-binding protein [Clostridia bacterium]|nr:DNA-binding protein [Clostridia bacterium]
MKQDNNMSMLLDFYGVLLTEKQRLALEMYYNMDFSLSEIADNIAVTRQCARDFIKKGEAHLLDFEDKAGFYNKFQLILDETRNIQNEILKTGADKTESGKNILKSVDNISDIFN